MKIAAAIAFLVASLVAATPPAFGQFYCVDDTAYGGANDGSSWENAFLELQEALHLATPGTTIFVAEGRYWPDWDPVGNTITGSRAASFQLKNGVTLLGGYPNGGGFYPEPSTYMTILTGDINAPLYNTDNSYHVVTAGAGIDDTAVLDGFSVWSGNADGSYPNERGGGIFLAGASPVLRQVSVQWNDGGAGGGIYVENAAPRLEDVTIAYNRASLGGGGMWNQGGSPHLIDVFVLQNQATGEGGGLFTQGGAPHIERSRFVENFGTRGGGITNWPGGSIELDSVELRGNSATLDIGGGIFNWQGLADLNNVTISGNSGPVEGGGIYLFNPNTVTIRNSIVWGNTGGTVNGNIATVSNSLIQGGYPGTNILNADPQFRTPGTDLRLTRNSPGLNAGDPVSCAAVDVRGAPRVAVCELGAYEYRGTPGTWWTNGEADLLHIGQSFDATPIGQAHRQSADDFVVPAGMVCDVSSFRGVLMDGSEHSDATAKLFASNLTELASWSVSAYCSDEPWLACSPAAGCPGSSTCILPGQPLGSNNSSFPLWEPRFDYIGMRLSPGTYWLSIYGTVESVDYQASWAISAGDGSIQSNPYIFREVGYSWVDGGVYWGDVSRDLALEVDAVCLVDADGDRSEAGVDCDDANPNNFPGNTEACDGVDNNCDGIVDTGFAPQGTPTLYVDRTQLSWTAVQYATEYDIVRGQLDELWAFPGDFTHANCYDDHVAGTTYELGGGIPHGRGFYFLVRATSACGIGSFNTGFEAQNRDPELAASTYACP